MASVSITGVQTHERGRFRVEVEVRGGSGRLRFAQASGPVSGSTVAALLVDGAPAVLALLGTETGALALEGPTEPTLPSLVAREASLDDADVLALASLLEQFDDGLYTISVERFRAGERRRGFVKGPLGVVPLAIADRSGAPVLASIGDLAGALLCGRLDDAEQRPCWVIRADVIIDAPGFEPRTHDRGTREAFARSPRFVLDDQALRDAIAAYHRKHPHDPLGPFTEDRIEPAAQVARALAWDLRAEDGIESVSELWRETVGPSTEFRAHVMVRGVSFELSFVSHDGRRIDEVLVRSGARFRATGVRPAARTLARTLRQLAEEGA